MSALEVVRSVLVSDGAVTDLVPAARIIADDVAPIGATLPLVLIKLVSGTDRHPLTRGNTVFQRKRVQIEMHCEDAASRAAVKKAIRAAALNGPFPVVSGLVGVRLYTEAEGPDFFVPETSVRIGEQDVIVTYSEII